ncbi:NUC173 domain-containing protein [Coemansia mojavensis]|nr:NUC173 domain-containing protein [Coemansia mojavensis]
MDSGLEQQLQRLRDQINSKAAHQQQHAAMLLAVEETIKEQKAAMEPGSYFAALLTLMEQQTGSNGLSNAALFLLSTILPYVSHTMLRAKFTTMMAVLSQSLDLSSADVALLKSVISCLEATLLAQDASSWKQPIAQATFKSLLQLSTDSKPKVRKRAQEAVSNLLSRPPPPTVIHPAASIASRFVLDVLSNAKADTQAAMHTLQLIKQTEMLWPADDFGDLCASLMQIPRLNTPFVAILAFQALERVFSSAGEALDEDQFRDLLISVIDLKPNINDSAASEAWLKIIEKGYIAYASVSADGCFQSLPDLIDLVLPDIELGKQSTRDAATRCIWALIRHCVPDSKLGSEDMQRIIAILTTGLSYRFRESWTLVFLLIAALFQRLGKFAHPSMDELIKEVASMRMEPEFQFKDEADAVLGAAVRAVGPQTFLEILPLNLDGESRQGDVGRAWLLPLMKSHIRNTPLRFFISDMLPLADRLSRQSQQFVSQGRDIEAKVFNALSQQTWALLTGFCNVPADIIESFTPEFAERLATELMEVPELRPAICGALQTLLTAVHSLAHKEIEDSPITQQQALAAEQHLARFAPDYLSQLFNVFAQSPGAGRGYLMDTITAFLAVISPSEINATFVKVCTMLDQALKTHKPPTAAELTERYLEAHPPPTAHTMTDLVIVMAPYLDAERTQMLMRAAFVLANQSEDAMLQKRGYKALSRLAEQPENSPARQIIESAMAEQLIPMLTESAESVAAGSRRDRLALTSLLARNLTDDQLHFIPAMLSEVIIGTKESNERARNIAFETLLVMGRRMSQGGTINMVAITDDANADMAAEQSASMEEFFKIAAAGLAAQTPHMISATIAAISRMLFEFHEQLNNQFIVELMKTILMFVVHNNREIAKASLGFVKVIAVVLPKEILLPHLSEIVPSICKWSHEYKNQMRLKCRHILDRLARRLGMDAVAEATPEEHSKLIANMRKCQQRSQRAKENGNAQRRSEDDAAKTVAAASAATGKKTFGSAYEDIIYGSESEFDESDEEERRGSKKPKGKKTKGGNTEEATAKPNAWIKEDAEGPLDFLDRSAFTHFSTIDPSSAATAKARRMRSQPKMRDGKLVFDDEEEEARKAQAAAEPAKNENAGEDYYVQSLTSKDGFYRTANQKIKFHKRKAGDSDDEMDIASDSETKSPAKKGKDNSGTAYGREFRSKKAAGDVKRGNIDPYAYIPLNPKTMKKGAIAIKNNSKKDKRVRRVKG